MAEDRDRFVGRVEELRRLHDIRRQIRDEVRGQVVLVSGPAGIGKTRLCEQDAGMAHRDGFAVVWGRCWPDGGAPAMWPWQPVLTQLCRPSTAALLDDDVGLDDVDPERFSRFVAVVDAIVADAPRPSYLILDDLHLAEPAAVLLTRFVARMRHRLPMLLVATVRDAANDERALRVVERLEPECVHIRLRPLGVADTQALLVDCGTTEPEPTLVSTVHQLTGGNPSYLRRALARSGPTATRWTSGLADGLREAVDASLRCLDTESLTVLAAAAVLGPAPSISETAEVSGVSPLRVLDAVDEAAAAGLVGQVRVDSFAFGHELVQEALVARLGAVERLEVHARAAGVLRGWGSAASHERLARRAHHARHAAARSVEEARDAVLACRAAASSMTTRFEFEQAAALLAAAASLHDHGGLEPAPADLLLDWARAVLSCGWLAEARARFERAIEAAEDEGDVALRAEAALGLGGVWVNEHRDLGRREWVLALQRAALAGLGPEHRVLRIRLQTRLAAELVADGGPLDDVLAALDRVRLLGDDIALAEALSLTHHVLLRPDHTDERLELADELIDVASAAGDGILALMGLCWRAVDLFHLGDPRAERALADLRTRAHSLNCRAIRYVASVLDVMALLRSGRLADGEAAAAECYRDGLEVGDADAFGHYAAQVVAIRWLQGRGGELVDLAVEATGSPTTVQAEFAFQALVAELAAESGQLDCAREALDRLTGAGLAALPQSSTWLTGMLAIVEAATALADSELSRQAYRLLLPFADLPIMPSLGVVCFGSVHRPLGLAARTAGDLDLAIDHLEAAVAANGRLGNRPLVACCRADLALALLRRGTGGDRRRAVELLDLAIDAAETMDMAARADRWRRARTDLAGGPPAARVVIGREQDHWTLVSGDRRVLIGDLAGMRYLARLVGQPGRSVPALELAGFPAGATGPSRQELLDGRARSAYATRALELAAQVAEARANDDGARVERLETEIDALTDEVEHATGLGRRDRAFTGPAERARTAVRKAIKRALDAIEAVDAGIAAELRATVSTGFQCCYTPAAERPPAVEGLAPARRPPGAQLRVIHAPR